MYLKFLVKYILSIGNIIPLKCKLPDAAVPQKHVCAELLTLKAFPEYNNESFILLHFNFILVMHAKYFLTQDEKC